MLLLVTFLLSLFQENTIDTNFYIFRLPYFRFYFYPFFSPFLFFFSALLHFLFPLFLSPVFSLFIPVFGGVNLPNSNDVTNRTFPAVVAAAGSNKSNLPVPTQLSVTHRSNVATNNTNPSPKTFPTQSSPYFFYTEETAEPTFSDNGSLDELQVDGTTTRQNSEHVIIKDDEDLTPKTQLRFIVDSDDETNASSSITNSRYYDS